MLIINKHFNFCCFRALAYATLDRLSAVFLYNHIIHPGVAKIYLVLKVSVVSADITISGKLFHTFTILDAKENFLKS